MTSNQTIYYIKTTDNLFYGNNHITINCITRIITDKKHTDNCNQYISINNFSVIDSYHSNSNFLKCDNCCNHFATHNLNPCNHNVCDICFYSDERINNCMYCKQPINSTSTIDNLNKTDYVFYEDKNIMLSNNKTIKDTPIIAYIDPFFVINKLNNNKTTFDNTNNNFNINDDNTFPNITNNTPDDDNIFDLFKDIDNKTNPYIKPNISVPIIEKPNLNIKLNFKLDNLSNSPYIIENKCIQLNDIIINTSFNKYSLLFDDICYIDNINKEIII